MAYNTKKEVAYATTLLITLLLLTTTTQALEETTKWVYSGDTIESGEDVLTVEYGSTRYDEITCEENQTGCGTGLVAEVVMLSSNEDDHLVRRGECKELTEYKMCFTKSGATDGDPDTHSTYEAGNKYFASHIKIKKITPELKIQRTAEKNILSVGEDTKITITLKNQGEEPIDHVTYEERLPKNLRLVSTPMEKKKNNRLVWEGFLNKEEQEKFYYRVRAEEYLTETLKGNATYVYKHLKKHETTDGITLSVPSPFSVTDEVTPETVTINQEATYKLRVKNNDETKQMDYKVTITKPEDLKTESEMNRERDTYKGSGVIPSEETKTFKVTATPKRTGEYPIRSEVDLEVSTETLRKKYGKNIVSELEPLEVDIRTSKVYRGKPYKAKLFVKNPNQNNNYYDLEGYLKTSKDERALIRRDTIPRGREVFLEEAEFDAPNRTEEELTANLTYKTINNEDFTLEKTTEVEFKEFQKTFRIQKEVDDEDPGRGDSVTVETTIKRVGEVNNTFIKSEERLPPSLEKVKGLTAKEITLEEGKERKVYTYTFRIPEDYQENTVPLKTVVKEKDSDRTESSTKTLVIEEEQSGEENQTRPSSENTTTEDVQEETVEEDSGKNIVEKVIDWFKNFF